jgi:DNA-binding transcriptional LysR family regulator
MQVEIRHARVVAMVSELGSISKAAAKLKLPQPSLTAQLRRIERAVGGDLFLRSSAGVTPTPLGERLIPMLIELAVRADAVIAEASAPSLGVLRLGNAEWTPATLCDAVQASLPMLEVETKTVDPATAVAAVRRGSLTAALLSRLEGEVLEETSGEPLDKLVVVREPVWVALPKGHPLLSQARVGWAQLASLKWVRHGSEHWFHAVEERLFERFDGDGLDVLHHIAGHAEAMSWVRDAGAAALTLPTGATRDVKLVPIAGTVYCQMILVWRRGASSPNTMRLLADAVRRYYCEYARTIPRYWSWMVDNPGECAELLDLLPETGQGLRGVTG